MGETPFIGEITMFVGDFAPRGWQFCNGQLLEISQNSALFSLIGNTYGGDGQRTFALPDLRGRGPVHFGTGPGLSPRARGDKYGKETVELTENELPHHTHACNIVKKAPNSDRPTGRMFGRTSVYATPEGDLSDIDELHAASITPVGGNMPHENTSPSLCVSFIIAVVGMLPPRS